MRPLGLMQTTWYTDQEEDGMKIIILMGSPNRNGSTSILVTVAWNADDWTFEALVAHYRTLVRYISFEDKGMVLGYGCGSPGMTKRSSCPEEAYRLGKSL